MASVDEDYFETMGIPLVRGRGFRATDTMEAPRVAIVNETLARRTGPAATPSAAAFVSAAITAVDSDRRRRQGLEGLLHRRASAGSRVRPVPPGAARQHGAAGENLRRFSAGRPPLGELVRDLDPDLPVSEAQTIEHSMCARDGFLKVATEMIGGIGVMGCVLTMVGLYGLVSYSVTRRTRDRHPHRIGATYAHVLRMILRQGMWPAWFGLPAGWYRA